MEKQDFSPRHLVSVGLVRIRDKIENCDINIIDDISSVTRELAFGRVGDKSIDKQSYIELTGTLENLKRKYKDRCQCSIKS